METSSSKIKSTISSGVSVDRLAIGFVISIFVFMTTLPLNCHSCEPGEFQCNITRKCIPENFVCDNTSNCGYGDTSDEIDWTCSTSQFTCNTTKRCINYRYQCDNEIDCADASDEIDCDPCPPWRFQCNDTKRCLSIYSRCNGVFDCQDFSDEINCLNYTRSCLIDEFRCNVTKRCFRKQLMCDGNDDCGDLSDEANCGNITNQCPANTLRCGVLFKRCVSNAFKCDGDNDCGDLTDEANCGYETSSCGLNRFKCDNGYCLNRKHACNGKNDCLDKSDERNCVNKRPCDTNDFRCSNGKCIRNSSICDGVYDCIDVSDELFCKHAALKISGDSIRITGLISETAIWQFNVTTNTNNWTVFMKNPKENEMNWNTTKYQVSVEQIAPLLYDLKIKVHFINWEDMGYYQFHIKLDGTDQHTSLFLLYLTVRDDRPPEFLNTNLQNSSLPFMQGKLLELVCNVTGLPRTKISWLRNNEVLSNWPPEVTYFMHQDNLILALQSVPQKSPGRFMCTAENANGSISAYVDIEFHNEVKADQSQLIFGVSGGILSLIVLVLCAIVIRYNWKQKKLKRMLSGLSEKEFYQGAVENLNPNISVSDQAHLLPFQQATWELPRENINLGAPLGSGAFGLVLKAEVKGIVEGEDCTTVAVKTVKPSADESHFKALITELKIMANLGKHFNVVNLIGACTKNLVKKRELLVVMEFCQYGCLLNYLLDKRSSFVNQLDPKSDKIECSTQIKKENRKKVVFKESSQKSFNSPTLEKYEECLELTKIEYIKTVDLLIWAFQVAKGMEYLSSKKVFHGDLAARNVLLTENKIAKICDFGYARETYKNYDYKKNIKGVLLPVKWMAIESIYCGVFSSKSDCWSYGVLLWEMFTLGNKPYPGMEVNEDFCQKLHDGYRLEKPEYASTSMYNLMKDSWAHEPSERPSFMKIANRLQEIIAEWDTNDYLNITEMYANLPDVDLSSITDRLMQTKETEMYVNTNGKSTTVSKRYQEVPTT